MIKVKLTALAVSALLFAATLAIAQTGDLSGPAFAAGSANVAFHPHASR